MVDLMLHKKVHLMVGLILRLRFEHLRGHYKNSLRCTRKWQKEGVDVSLDGVFEGAFVSAIEDPTEGFSGDTPKDVP